MNNLTYLVNWGKDKKNAWSGTNFSLYNALGKYFEVNDINLNGNRWTNAFMSRVLRMDGATIEYYRRHQLGKKLRNTTGNVFQFSEVLSDNDKRKTYMYVDNTVSYLNYLRMEKPDIYAVSAFQNSNSKIFDKRGKEQDEYIRSCSALFTMGHWLREWLISRGFSSDRIYAVGGGPTLT